LPSVQQRLPSLLDRPIAFAHRGARAHAPENTLEAFTLALRLGATGLESDVWVTADGVAVLEHDGVVGGFLRRRDIADLRRAELPGHIPTLEELLVECGTGHDLSLDLKDPDAGGVVLEVVERVAPELRPRLWLCHPDMAALGALRAVDDEVRLVHSTKLVRLKQGPERHAAELASAGIDAVNLHHNDWNGGLAALYHRFERCAFGWDMHYEHVIRAALRMGLDAVYSDHVDVMIDAYRAELGAPG
jgi:glycerophosphoryl diester phosphodiesterase